MIALNRPGAHLLCLGCFDLRHRSVAGDRQRNNDLLMTETQISAYASYVDPLTSCELIGKLRCCATDGMVMTMIRDEILRDVCHAMALKLQQVLPLAGGEAWWRWYVVQQLSEIQQASYSDLPENDVFGLDMASLLRIFQRNWSELAAKGHLPKRGAWLVGKMIDARNRWAHQPARGVVDTVELKKDFDVIHQFLVAIGANCELVDRVGRYRDKLQIKLKRQSGSVVTRDADSNSAVLGITDGAAKGVEEGIRGASGWLIPASDFSHLVRLLKEQSAEYKRLVIRAKTKLNGAARTKNRALLLDTMLVGGETLAAGLASGDVPDNVLDAYTLTYPNEAATHTFAEKIDQLDTSQLVGFASGIKGKLFEIEYVKYLNGGKLPQGYSAELPDSPNNPGWDIAIKGPDAHVVDIIQLKATESVDYVKEALERYPEIDVVTPQEVYGQLVMQGLAENVANSGISETALDQLVQGAIDDANPSLDFVPTPISLALIAFSVYSRDDLSAFEKNRELGVRSAKSYLAYLAGNAVAVLTNTWWLGMLGGVGSRLLLDAGRERDLRLANMQALVDQNSITLGRMRRIISHPSSA